MPISHLENLNDQKLYNLCKFYGEQAKKWRYKFMGLLPEVNRRRLFEKRGFQSIFEFSKKLAGLSEEQVRRVLNLEKRFEKTPILKSLLLNGEVSVNKLARVASIATKENEEILANQAKILSKNALETLVKDEKESSEKGAGNKDGNGLQQTFFGNKSVPGHRFESSYNSKNMEVAGAETNAKLALQLGLSFEVLKKLIELQNKGININKFIIEALQKRELQIAQEKEQLAQEIHEKATHNSIRVPVSRYIPVKIKNLLQKEHGNKCSIPTCQKPAETIHHTQRFALAHMHDPRYLAPLCKEHHTIAHSIDLKFLQKRMG